MARKLIPAQTIYICDCCGNEMTHNWRLRGVVRVEAAALDFSGSAVGSDEQGYELCDTCFSAVKSAINETISGRKA